MFATRSTHRILFHDHGSGRRTVGAGFGYPDLDLVDCLAVSFDVKPSDYGTSRDIYMRLITADGRTLNQQRFTAAIQTPDPNNPGKLQVLNLVMVMQRTTFEKPGPYEFVIEVNTRHMASIPFEVVHAQIQ